MKYTYYLAALVLLLTSCIKDEPKNMECDILAAWVEGDNLDQYFLQPTDMRIGEVSSTNENLTFVVKSRAALPPMEMHFTLTPGATVIPANCSVQDFSKGPVTYTVTSEDGQSHRIYNVDFHDAQLPSNKYDFETFILSANGRYYEWYEIGTDGTEEDIWATGNAGYIIAKPNALPTEYPTVPDEQGYDGSCVRLTTYSTGSWGKLFKKPIAAGNLFLGNFNTRYVLTNTLRATEMGIPYTKEPVKVTGYYKYTPGPVFTDKDFNELTDRVDEPSLYAVLYLNHDDAGNEIMLHGDNVLSSPYIVRKAQVTNPVATTEWKRFEMTFEGTTPIDYELLASRGYNLAMVFSASKTGDLFEGAVGSTLYIDKVEVTFKE